MDLLTQLQYTIVGTLIQEPNKVGEALTQLSVADFPSAAARGIFEALGDLHFSGAPIDAVTVLDKAGEDYAEAILEARQQYTFDLDYYIAQLKGKNRLRNLQRAAEKIVTSDSLEQIEQIVEAMNLSMVDSGRRSSFTPVEAATRMMQRLSEPVSDFLRWGISSFDRALRVRRGNFVVIGGYPGSGKTLLSLQIAAEWAKKYRVGYFSLEMTVDEIEERITSHLAKVPLTAVMDHQLSDKQWDAITKAMDLRSRLSLRIEPASGMTVREIQAAALAQRYEIIFIDYLQIVHEKGQSRFEIVTNISQGIATMARRHNIIVVALSQLQRTDKTRSEPTLSSFRESGQIEQDVDVALLVYPEQDKDNTSRRKVRCVKNRNGRLFATLLEFRGETQTMMQYTPPDHIQKPLPDWVQEAERAEQISYLEAEST